MSLDWIWCPLVPDHPGEHLGDRRDHLGPGVGVDHRHGCRSTKNAIARIGNTEQEPEVGHGTGLGVAVHDAVSGRPSSGCRRTTTYLAREVARQ